MASDILKVFDVSVKSHVQPDVVKVPKPRGRPKKAVVAGSKKQGHPVSGSVCETLEASILVATSRELMVFPKELS